MAGPSSGPASKKRAASAADAAELLKGSDESREVKVQQACDDVGRFADHLQGLFRENKELKGKVSLLDAQNDSSKKQISRLKEEIQSLKRENETLRAGKEPSISQVPACGASKRVKLSPTEFQYFDSKEEGKYCVVLLNGEKLFGPSWYKETRFGGMMAAWLILDVTKSSLHGGEENIHISIKLYVRDHCETDASARQVVILRNQGEFMRGFRDYCLYHQHSFQLVPVSEERRGSFSLKVKADAQAISSDRNCQHILFSAMEGMHGWPSTFFPGLDRSHELKITFLLGSEDQDLAQAIQRQGLEDIVKISEDSTLECGDAEKIVKANIMLEPMPLLLGLME